MPPWLDRAGRFSPLKATTLVLLCLPAIWIGWLYMTDGLGVRWRTEIIHQTGLWAVRLLLVSLAVSPARQLLRWPRVILVRRMIGVAAFAYAAAHLAAYALDQMLDLGLVAREILRRFYLTIGFVTLIGLLALAATSTDAMIRRLGPARWQRLHRIVYGLGLLALVHFFLQSRADVTEPTVLAGCFAWLMAYRLLRRRGLPGWPKMAALGLAAAGFTMAGEAAYFGLATGIQPRLVLMADFSLVAGLRPCWLVLAAGMAVTLAAAWRGRPPGHGGAAVRMGMAEASGRP